VSDQSPSPQFEEFVAGFFSAPNRISLTDIQSPDGKWARLRPLLKDLETSPSQSVVLPCWRNDSVEWYGLAFSETQVVALRENLLAFVGPTYSTFRGIRAELDPSDPVEGAVARFTNGRALKFAGPAGKDGSKDIWNALELMRSVLQRRPLYDLDVPRPLGRVLRDFFMALEAGNAASAQSLLSQVSEQNRLDPINILFLRVQLLESAGDWSALLTLQELPDLLQMRRPLAVTGALLQAVYELEIKRFEAPLNVAGMVDHFRNRVQPLYGPLMSQRMGLNSPAASKLLMLFAVTNEPPRLEWRDALLQGEELSQADRLTLSELSARIPVSGVREPADPIVDSLKATAEGEFEGAFASAVKAAPSVPRTTLLVRCAYELQTLEAEQAAIKAFIALKSPDREAFLRSRSNKQFLEAMAWAPGLSDDLVVPDNWGSWLRRVEQDPGWQHAGDVARRGAREWSIPALVDAVGAVNDVAARLTAQGEAPPVQDALPYLIAFLKRDDSWPRSAFVPIYKAVLDVIALGSLGVEDDLALYYEVLAAILATGVSESAYGELLELTQFLLTKNDSLARVTWALDVLDLMVVYPCPLAEARIGLLADVSGLFQKYRRRLDASAWALFEGLCDDLGHSEVFRTLLSESPSEAHAETTPTPINDVFSLLKGKVVGIYTLTESVGRRVRDLLQQRTPGVDVQLCHDKVATDRLKQVARDADIMIVVTGSATHSATGFIDDQRGKANPSHVTLRPTGKGSASLLKVLYQHLVAQREESTLEEKL